MKQITLIMDGTKVSITCDQAEFSGVLYTVKITCVDGGTLVNMRHFSDSDLALWWAIVELQTPLSILLLRYT